MAKARSLIIKSSDALGNTYQKTMTNVNPEATNTNIDALARALIGLSTQNYVDTVKVETESVNEAIIEENLGA